MTQTTFNFDGQTFDKARDGKRLSGQMQRVFSVMQDGEWRTLDKIHVAIKQRFGKRDPHQSISARLRDLRKDRFGGHTVDHKFVSDGVWEYRLEANQCTNHPE